MSTIVVAASAVPESPGCLPPTAIVKWPGSTTRVPSWPTSESARSSRVKRTTLFSPGSSETRSKPLSARSGTGPEASTSVTYSCTTSSAAIAPAFRTSTETATGAPTAAFLGTASFA